MDSNKMNEALKIARIEAKKTREANILTGLKLVLGNPIIEELLLVMFIKYYEDNSKASGWFEHTQESVKSAALFTAGNGLIFAQQLAPLMPYVSANITDITKMLPNLMPLLAAGG
jgi:hypothetical protein